MKLFLCSHFARVGTLLKEDVVGKNVLFIPTASIHESYKGYVDEARAVWHNLNTHLVELEISTASLEDIQGAFDNADILYFTGGNTFFLIDQIRKTGVDKLIKQHVESGKLYVGESGGAIICADELSYIKPMDEVPGDFSQADYLGLNLIDFYVVPHYLCFPFEKCSEQIVDENPDLAIWAINNEQAILVEGDIKRELCISE